MLRAAFTHINDRPISLESYQDEDAQRLVAREFNLSHAMSMQPDNRIVAGRWWREAESEEPLFSVEQGLAKKLGIQLDDNLSFDLAGSRISGRVSNLRTVRRDSFRPNFLSLLHPGCCAITLQASSPASTWSPAERRSCPILSENFRR